MPVGCKRCAAVSQPATYRREPRAMRSTNRTADRNSMARGLAVLLFFFSVCVGAQAQNDNWDNLSKAPERLIGLLDLPDIVAYGCGPAPNRATTRAFATPSQNGRSVGTIYWREERDV